MFRPSMLFASLCLLLLLAHTGYAQQPFTSESLTVTVYTDGTVHVEYVVAVSPDAPSVDVRLLGETFESLTVADEDGFPLEYELLNSILTVITLGSSQVTISYDTADLTNKTGKYWTLSFNSPVEAVIILPPEAVIISLSCVPESIESREGRTILTMPKGTLEVTYTISIVGTREHAAVLIGEAEEAISKAKAAGIDVEEAEELLKKAKEAFDAGDYAQAESFAKQARELAEQAAIETPITPPPAKPSPPFPQAAWTVGGALAAVILIILVVLVLRRRGKAASFSSLPEPFKVSLDRIFREHGEALRHEDREALQVIAESGGRMFESELRERLRLPKTSLWRLVRRLEKLGVVEVRKVGGQNLVCVKPEYRE